MDLTILQFDPVRMVFINLVASTLLVVGTLFYKFIYPRRNVSKTLFCVLISILPILSVFRSGSYESGDMLLHSARAASFYNSLTEGIIIPRWYSEANAGYGYPLFLFSHPLPYYITSLFHFLGFGFVGSIKLLLITTYLLSGLLIYSWVKRHLSKEASLIAAVFYLFAPYHLIDMHFRVSIGEMTALMILPLVLILLKKYLENPTTFTAFISSMSFGLFVLSHQAIPMLSLPFIFLYGFHILKTINTKAITKILIPLGVGVLFSAYYWVPVFWELKFTHQPFYARTILFDPLSSFFYSPWRFGLLFQGHQGEFVTIVGYAQAIIIFYSMLLITKASVIKQRRKLIVVLLLYFFFLLFLTNRVSSPIWNLLYPLKNIQFTYRLSGMIMLIVTLISALVFEIEKSEKLFYFLIFAVSFPTILNWGNRGMDTTIVESKLNDYKYVKQKGGIVIISAATPKWANPYDPWQKEFPEQKLELINGKAKITNRNIKTTRKSYVVDVTETALLKENTAYFPGWELYVDGQKTNIDYTNKNHFGVITFRLVEGVHDIRLVFLDTKIRTYSFLLSSTTMLIFGSILVINSQKLPTPPSTTSKTTPGRSSRKT